VLRGFNRLKPDKWNLHGAKQTKDEEGVVGNVDPVGKAIHQDQDEHMKWDQVDDENIATPGRHLQQH